MAAGGTVVTPQIAFEVVSAFVDVSDPAHLKEAEAAVHRMAACPGAALSLATVFSEAGASEDVRRAAGLFLRQQIVRRRWLSASESGPVPAPAVDPTEAASVREIAPRTLGDASRRIRTVSAQLVAALGRADWPTRWPGLFDSLCAAAKGEGCPAGSPEQRRLMDGAMRCLAYFVEDIPASSAVAAASVLLPHCIGIASAASSAPLALKRRAVRIALGLLRTLSAAAHGHQQAEVVALVGPAISPLLSLIAGHLSSDPAADPRAASLQVSVLALAEELCVDFSSLIAPHASGTVKALFGFATRLLPWYVAHEVDADVSAPSRPSAGDAEFDSDDEADAVGEALAAKTLDVMMQVCTSSDSALRLQSKPWLKEVAGLAIGFAQLRTEDQEAWSSDAEALLSEGDELNQASDKARGAAVLLVRTLVSERGHMGIRAVTDAAAERAMPAAQVGAAAGAGAAAWKMQEAGMLLLGGVGPRLVKWWSEHGPGGSKGPPGSPAAGTPAAAAAAAAAAVGSPGPAGSPGSVRSASGPPRPLQLRPDSVAAHCFALLTGDISACGVAGASSRDTRSAPAAGMDAADAAEAAQYLRARALWTAGRVSKGLTDAQAEPFVGAAITALSADGAGVPLRIAACKALVRFAKRMPPSAHSLRARVPEALGALASLLARTPASVVPVVLRAVVECLSADPKAAAASARDLSTVVVAMWIRAGNHFELGEDLKDTIVRIAKIPDPAVSGMLADRFAPTFAQALVAATTETSGSAAAAAEMLAAILEAGPRPPVAKAAAALPAILAGCSCPDRSVRQPAAEALASFVYAAGGEQLVDPAWRDPSSGRSALDTVLAATAALLEPPPPDSPPGEELAGMFAGVVVMAVAQRCAAQVGPSGAARLVAMVGRRAITVRMPSVAGRLCTAFASFLAQHPGPTAAACATESVPAPEWMAKAGLVPAAGTSVPLLNGVLQRMCLMWPHWDAPMARTVMTVGVLKLLSADGGVAATATSAAPLPGHGPEMAPVPQRLIQLVALDLADRHRARHVRSGEEWEADDDVAWGVEAGDDEAAAAAAQSARSGLGSVRVRYEDVGEDVDAMAMASAGAGLADVMDADELMYLTDMIGSDALGGAMMMGGGMMGAGSDDEDDEDDDPEDGGLFGGGGDIDKGDADDRQELWAREHPLRDTDRSKLISQFFQAAAGNTSTPVGACCCAAMAAFSEATRKGVIDALASSG
ncbi:hypothetical protein FNF31_06288 [Cafeteria roenbergensis]|uniref:Importin N-terminal domain-containing protein n=1 Tax=Cafeteria roenbergensis TaxID=33653 RepID=A0A5A8DY43_CAFRO|nr:hypothetical protein FNF31_06288 [Cafeteria roenbergensis]KAA0168651.1 hypothetical protein FNF28_02391 [Cafeteria roenbergensis]